MTTDELGREEGEGVGEGDGLSVTAVTGADTAAEGLGGAGGGVRDGRRGPSALLQRTREWLERRLAGMATYEGEVEREREREGEERETGDKPFGMAKEEAMDTIRQRAG